MVLKGGGGISVFGGVKREVLMWYVLGEKSRGRNERAFG